MKAIKGLKLGGRYKLQQLLATGGMGEVWSARDLSVGRVVAVKVLRDEYTGNLEFLRRLRTEARNSAALAHPNIAQMFDYGEDQGTGYLVMELVGGQSMADLLEHQPVVPAKTLIPILADTARGLHHAHINSVVHRDVKPGNILLDDTLPGQPPSVKITDFGVSLAANQAPMTATGMVMGTAQYLSPEQAVGSPATAQSDLYGLGVIAYEAVAGKRPFTGKSPVDIAIAHVNDPVEPLPDSVDPDLASVVYRLLSKRPEQRHANASELADELDRLSLKYNGLPIANAATEIATDAPAIPSRRQRRLNVTSASLSVEDSAATPVSPLQKQPPPKAPTRSSIRRPLGPAIIRDVDAHQLSSRATGNQITQTRPRFIEPNRQIAGNADKLVPDVGQESLPSVVRAAKAPSLLAIALLAVALIVVVILLVWLFANRSSGAIASDQYFGLLTGSTLSFGIDIFTVKT
jgi:serine/threonine-protein kinase